MTDTLRPTYKDVGKTLQAEFSGKTCDVTITQEDNGIRVFTPCTGENKGYTESVLLNLVRDVGYRPETWTEHRTVRDDKTEDTIIHGTNTLSKGSEVCTMTTRYLDQVQTLGTHTGEFWIIGNDCKDLHV